MQVGKSVLKVAGGKLLRVEVEHEAGIVKKVRLTGDFFIYPEEALIEMEKALEGCELGEVAERVDNTAARLGAQLVGFSPADVQEVVRLATEQPAAME